MSANIFTNHMCLLFWLYCFFCPFRYACIRRISPYPKAHQRIQVQVIIVHFIGSNGIAFYAHRVLLDTRRDGNGTVYRFQ